MSSSWRIALTIGSSLGVLQWWVYYFRHVREVLCHVSDMHLCLVHDMKLSIGIYWRDRIVWKVIKYNLLSLIQIVSRFCFVLNQTYLNLINLIGKFKKYIRIYTIKICPSYEQDNEIIEHILCGCVFARQVWSLIFRHYGLRDFSPFPDDSIFCD